MYFLYAGRSKAAFVPPDVFLLQFLPESDFISFAPRLYCILFSNLIQDLGQTDHGSDSASFSFNQQAIVPNTVRMPWTEIEHRTLEPFGVFRILTSLKNTNLRFENLMTKEITDLTLVQTISVIPGFGRILYVLTWPLLMHYYGKIWKRSRRGSLILKVGTNQKTWNGLQRKFHAWRA